MEENKQERENDMLQTRVCCLYRVSTDKQVDHTDQNIADIPMQRKACHRFAEKMGWIIIHEEQEEGVSGHKVRAENRDKLQIIKEMALAHQFDIFLVFMFDRIGRIADETPFVVEWFVKNGIQVWSTQEGEQRFDNHIDKLLNYIRFWQADGESVKTSVRTKTSLGQMVEEGHFKGGFAAYGYDLVKSGRLNKKKHELSDLKINDYEASVVKLIFNKYVNEGCGAQRISTYLNTHGYKNRKGKAWHPASIRGILCNLTYTGVLRCGESRSPVLPDLQIISSEQFEAAQRIRSNRSEVSKESPSVPLNTRGRSLLAGNVYCGHCGARLTLTTSGKYRCRKDGTVDKSKRIRYVCYGKTRKQTDCSGPTGYTMRKLDALVNTLVCQLFAKMKTIPKDALITTRLGKELEVRKAHLAEKAAEYRKAQASLDLLNDEILKCLRGESAFSKETLAKLISEAEAKSDALRDCVAQAEADAKGSEQLLEQMLRDYEQIVSWAELYNTVNDEAKKMILNCLIRRVEVYEGYKLKIYFNVVFEQFFKSLDDSE